MKKLEMKMINNKYNQLLLNLHLCNQLWITLKIRIIQQVRIILKTRYMNFISTVHKLHPHHHRDNNYLLDMGYNWTKHSHFTIQQIKLWFTQLQDSFWTVLQCLDRHKQLKGHKAHLLLDIIIFLPIKTHIKKFHYNFHVHHIHRNTFITDKAGNSRNNTQTRTE